MSWACLLMGVAKRKANVSLKMAKKTMDNDVLAKEMARFEQEVLGVAASAPPRPAVRPKGVTVSAPPTTSHPPRTAPAPPPPQAPAAFNPALLMGHQSSTPVSLLGIQAVVKNSEDRTGQSSSKKSKQKQPKKDLSKLRIGGGQVWEDLTLHEWDPNDYRIFCGDLGNDVSDDTLAKAFMKYPSFMKAKVIRDKWSKKTKGFGFVSFKDPHDFMEAMREMNGKYIGSRPVRLKKSLWKDRSFVEVKKREKEEKKKNAAMKAMQQQ